VVSHARLALSALEMQQTESRAQVDLFAPPPDLPAAELSLLEKAMDTIDPDALSPREALDALYRLKKLLNTST
jgi:DNA mismatch repair protein MutS